MNEEQTSTSSQPPIDYKQYMLAVDAALGGLGGGVGASPLGVPSSADDPLLAPVYMGGTRPNPNASRYNGKPVPGAEGGLDIGPSDDTTTVGDAYDEFHRMSPAERRAFARKLERLGVLEPGSYGYGDLAALWREAVDESADIYRASGRKVTPSGYLDLMAQTGMGSQGTGDDFDTRDKSSSTEKVNSTNTNLSTRADARARIREAFQSELGRDPTRKETRAFFRALRAEERSNPSRTTGTRSSTSVTNRKRNGNQSTSTTSNDNTTTRGGVGQEFDANYIDDRYDKELDARRTATDYYDVLLGMTRGGL